MGVRLGGYNQVYRKYRSALSPINPIKTLLFTQYSNYSMVLSRTKENRNIRTQGHEIRVMYHVWKWIP